MHLLELFYDDNVGVDMEQLIWVMIRTVDDDDGRDDD